MCSSSVSGRGRDDDMLRTDMEASQGVLVDACRGTVSPTDVTFTAQRRADGRYQFVARRALQHVSQRAGLEATLHQDRIAMDRHEDDPGGRVPAQDRGGGRDPVEARHRDVADNHVRRHPLGGADERETVLAPARSRRTPAGADRAAVPRFPRDRRRAAGVAETWSIRVERPESMDVRGSARNGRRTEAPPEKLLVLPPKNY